MVHDIEGDSVVLDKAQALGLMGYPDILGREVTVSLASPGSRPVVGEWQWSGTVVGIGPLGFVLRTVQQQTMIARGKPRGVAGTSTDNRFFPWPSVHVHWGEFKPDDVEAMA